MNYTILLPLNDAESQLIAKIFAKYRPDIQIRELQLDWGERLGSAPDQFDFDTLGEIIVIVEMPDPDFEARVINSGRKLITIDHHAVSLADGTILDRRSVKPSIIQLIDMFQINAPEMQHEIQLVAAYDISSYRGVSNKIDMLELGETKRKLASKIYQDELAIRNKFIDPNNSSNTMDWETLSRKTACEAEVFQSRLVPDLRNLHVVKGPLEDIDHAREAYIHHKMENDPESFANAEILSISTSKNDKDNPVYAKLFYTGNGHAQDIVNDLVNRCCENPDPLVSIHAGGDTVFSYFGAEGSKAQIDQLYKLILSNVMVGNRPLENWQTSFFQPLKIEKGIDSAEIFRAVNRGCIEFAPASQDARNYLIGSLQQRIAPTDDQMKQVLESGDWMHADVGKDKTVAPIMSFRIKNEENAAYSVTVEKFDGHEQNKTDLLVEEPVKEIFLHISPDGIGILEWRFERDAEIIFGLEDKNQQSDLEKSLKANRISNVAELQEFNNFARMAYRMYGNNYEVRLCRYDLVTGEKTQSSNIANEAERGAKAEPTGWMGALVTRALNACGIKKGVFSDEGGPVSWLILDERARFVSSMVPKYDVPSLPSSIEAWEIARGRFNEADGHDEKRFYDKAFMNQDLDQATYRRFQYSEQCPGSSTLYQATSHSFTMLGFGCFSADEALMHMRDIYARMYLLVLFYESTFQTLWLELAQAAKCHGGDDVTAQEAQRIKADISAFSNAFWFKTISTQVQGVELFDLMMKRSRAEQDFEELQNQISRSEEIANAVRDRRAEVKRDRFGYLLGVIAIFLAIIEIANYAKFSKILEKNLLFEKIKTCFGVSNNALLEVLIYFLIAISLTILANFLMRRFFERSSRGHKKV